MIRIRLAVFLAVAIVFAPGAGVGHDTAKRHTSNVAARMLAPTFDEAQVAGYQSTVRAKKAQNQERRHVTDLDLVILVGTVWLPNFRSHGRLSESIKRRLRLVVFSRRERGPPHLRLV